MRIIAGQWRGRRLAVRAGRNTRPTGDRVREALFSSLHSRLGSFVELRVLDAFAGSGALGFEALSRGAALVTAVERDAASCRVIEQNLHSLLDEDATTKAATSRYRLIKGDVFKVLPALADASFDLVFLDPPYEMEPTAIQLLLTSLASCHALALGSLVVIERGLTVASDDRAEEQLWPEQFCPQASKTIGGTCLHFGVFGIRD